MKKFIHTFQIGILTILLFVCQNTFVFGQGIPAGSFIINMGIIPQTIGNGLKPYGLIYDLIKNHSVPVYWVINPDKAKDGKDFTYNGTDYKGGTFIIPKAFINSAVAGKITAWIALGVAGAYTTSELSLTPTYILTSVPTWTLDLQNGALAQPYFSNAGIPSSSYNWESPALLGVCNDLFVMPHADPAWSTHGNLYNWNLTYKGSIWLGCHAGSAMANMYNPANTNQQCNFLMEKVTVAGTGIILPVAGSTSYSQNSLILWGNHSGPSIPFITTSTNPPETTFPVYNSPTLAAPNDPIAQYMGASSLAHLNGSEQVYLPVLGGGLGGWRPTTKVITYDPTQADVPSISNGPAVIIAYGRGFGDSNRGYVMYESGHSLNKGTAGDVPAQRAFFNWSFLSTIDKVPVINSISGIPSGGLFHAQPYPQNYPLTVSYSSPVSSGFSSVTWTCRKASDGTTVGTFTPNGTLASATTSFTPPNTMTDIPAIISVVIVDACGRITFDSAADTIKACNVTVINTITAPACYGLSNGSIAMAVSGGTSPYSWAWNRTNPSGGPVTGSGTTITGLSTGTYSVTVTDVSLCTSSFSALVPQPGQLTAVPAVTNVLCYGGTSGSTGLTAAGGTAPYIYDWADVPGTNNTKDRTGLAIGTYSVTVTDFNSCTAAASAAVTQPAATLSVSDSITNVSCYNGTNGAVNITASGGTPPYTYDWADIAGTNNTEDRSGLAAGTYNVKITDANGCFIQQNFTITQPPSLSLSEITTNPSCPADAQQNGSNGAIDLSVSGGTAGYTYSWTASSEGIIPAGQQSNQDLSGLVAGTYSVTITDSKSCTKSISIILNYLNPNPVPPLTINH